MQNISRVLIYLAMHKVDDNVKLFHDIWDGQTLCISVLCSDVDECAGTDVLYHNCAAGTTNAYDSDYPEVRGKCVNLAGSFECNCRDGYMWNSDVCDGMYNCARILVIY